MRSSASWNCSRILLRSHHLVTFLTPSTFVSRAPKSKRPFILSCSLASWCNGQKIVTCSGVSRSWPQAQAALVTSGTPILWRKSLSPIFPVRNCTRSALCRFLIQCKHFATWWLGYVRPLCSVGRPPTSPSTSDCVRSLSGFIQSSIRVTLI